MSAASGSETVSSNSDNVSNSKNWLPLEADPVLMSKYLHTLGADTQQLWAFHDIYGVDDDMLSMVPTPVLAVLLLFPINSASETYREQEIKSIETEGQIVSNNVYFTKQTTGNACGTIALLHTVFNLTHLLQIDDNKFFGKFYNSSKSLSPDDRAVLLDNNDDIESEHAAIASEGATSAHDAINTDLHFIAFVHVDGHLYELDGRKPFPINHGKCSQETLLHDSVNIVKQFMDRNPADVRFNMVALAPAMEE